MRCSREPSIVRFTTGPRLPPAVSILVHVTVLGLVFAVPLLYVTNQLPEVEAGAALLGRQIDDHRTRRHCRDHLACDEHGWFRPGTTAAAITTSLSPTTHPSTRSATASHTGRSRGAASNFRRGIAWSMYLRTVTHANPSSRATARCDRPSTSTLCRTI